MKLFILPIMCAAVSLLTLCANGVQAQVSIAPVSVTASITQGATLTFTADVTNTSNTALTLGGDNINFLTQAGPTELGPNSDPAFLSLDDAPFTPNVTPVTLAANTTQTFTFYNLSAGAAATPGTYTGYFVLQDDTQNDLTGGTQNFSFTVLAAAPEPAGWAALVIGAGMLGAVAVRRRRIA